MTSATRMAIGIPLTIIGVLCFGVFTTIALISQWLGYGGIVASVVSLLVVFGAGALLCPSNWKVGFFIAIGGLVGVIFFVLLAWAIVPHWEGSTIHDLGPMAFSLLFIGLGWFSLAIMVNGLGMLSGRRILPRISKVHSDTTPQPPDEPGEE